jgi:hypothetical protein
MSVYQDFFKRAFLRKLAQAFPFPRGVNEIGLPMRDRSKRVFHPDEPEKMIQKRQKFDYGDSVEVLRNGSGMRSGSTGFIKGMRIREDGDLDYLVGTDTTEKLINGKDLAPTNKQKQSVSRPVFQIGSRVKTSKGTGYIRGWPATGGYDYYEIDSDDQPVTYELHVGNIKPFSQQTQNAPVAPQKFKRGDQIRVIKDNDDPNTVGRTGVIDGYDADNGVYQCYLGGYGKTTQTEDELELRDGPAAQQNQQFKVGDRVKIKGATKYYVQFAGETAVIVSKNSNVSNGEWNLQMDSDGTSLDADSSELELVP